MQNLARTALVALFGLAVNVSAEPRVCIGGDLDRLSQTEKNSCRAMAARVQRDATRFHAQDDWHFVVVCTESDWATYAALSTRGTALTALNVDTDVKRKMTFFRGATLLMGDTLFNRRLIAREAVRGLMVGANETAIEMQVAVLVPEGGDPAVAVAGTR